MRLFGDIRAIRGGLWDGSDYKILHKGNGIYYISLKGGVAEKSLLIQFVVYSELPDSELFLKAIGADGDREQVRKVLEYAQKQKDYNLFDSFWGRYFLIQNHKVFLEEADMNQWKDVEKTLVKAGLTEKWKRQAITDVAKKLLMRGISVDDVVAATGLDLNDVLKLKGKI